MQALHVEADDVYITKLIVSSLEMMEVQFILNQTMHCMINNTEFNYNSAVSGGAVEVVSDTTVVITWCNFINNKALQFGGAIHVNSGSVSISGNTLTNNSDKPACCHKIHIHGFTVS